MTKICCLISVKPYNINIVAKVLCSWFSLPLEIWLGMRKVETWFCLPPIEAFQTLWKFLRQWWSQLGILLSLPILRDTCQLGGLCIKIYINFVQWSYNFFLDNSWIKYNFIKVVKCWGGLVEIIKNWIQCMNFKLTIVIKWL